MVHVRRLTEADLDPVWRLHLVSRDDLLVRFGRTPPAAPDPVNNDFAASLRSERDGFWCAEEEGELLGFAAAVVRGRIWFLSSFWVLPEHQGKGIGRTLLERALAYGRERGASVRSVWASLDARAQASYIRAGMVPRWPIYRVEATPAALAVFAAHGAGLEPVVPAAKDVAALEAPVWDADRSADHERWCADPANRVCGLARGGRLAAFAYLRGGRFVGPAAGIDEEALVQAVALAVSASSGDLVLRVPGPAFRLLAELVRAGCRVGDLAIFMSSETFGQPERYLPSGAFLY